MKENDYFLNTLTNPDFNPLDFKSIGLNTENTSLESKEVYKNLDFIQTNPLLQTDGKFDESKFDAMYQYAAQQYKMLADDEVLDNITNDTSFYRNNIYAPEENKQKEEEYYIKREINPLRQSKGLIHPNDVQESPLSIREIAQTQKVWDEATKTWQDAPNESWFDNFFETRVLAQWDEDGEHVDPITKQLVKHTKGQKKINENGTFYYENLNGRDIYGREVLSKFDTLTVDGTFVNKFDFFDSDDKEKSFTGNLVKNAAKVVPALVGGPVSLWYIGARIGLNTVDLMAKLGKVFAGSDSPTLSAIEGFTKSLSFSTSDYAQGSEEAEIPAHAWSLENLLNIGADTFTQLAEQRWIFQHIPALIKGKNIYDSKVEASMRKEAVEDYFKKSQKEITEAYSRARSLDSELEKVNQSVGILSKIHADNVIKSYMKDFNQIGKHVSQAYMTGITVADAYGEAKMEGASDLEAALLTLGYAIGEYGIINSDLGQWILPELKADKQRFKMIGRKLLGDPQPTESAPFSEKANWMQRLINWGKKQAKEDYFGTTASLAKSVVGGAMAEGVEESAEELLYDFSKTIFNAAAYLSGSDTQLTAFNNVAERYGLSFVGGMLGGTIGAVQNDFQVARKLGNMDKDQAFQQLVHLVNENEDEKFMKVIKKMDWAPKNLSSKNISENPDAPIYLAGNSTDNQNQAVIDAMQNEINLIKDVLNANGGTVSERSLLKTLTNADKDMRFVALQASTFAPQYLQEFNTIQTRIYDIVQQINAKQEGLNVPDSKQNDPEFQSRQEQLKGDVGNLKQQLKILLQQKEDLIHGKRSGEFISKALWEMSSDVSGGFVDVNFIQFAESKEKKSIKEIAKTPEVLARLKQEWEDFSATNRKDALERGYQVFIKGLQPASDILKQHDLTYFQNLVPGVQGPNIFNLTQDKLSAETRKNVVLGINVEGQEELITEQAKRRLEGGSDFIPEENIKYTILTSILGKLPSRISKNFETKVQALEGLTPEEQSREIIDMLGQLFTLPETEKMLKQQLSEIKFLNPAERQYLTRAFSMEMDFNMMGNQKAARLAGEVVRGLRSKPYSPVDELLDNYENSIGSSVRTSDLITQLESQLIQAQFNDSVSEFGIGGQTQEVLNTALNNIKLLRSYILSMRTDAVSATNLVGYTAAVNEVNGTDYATIDKTYADVLIQDLDKRETTLTYFKKLNEINSGQKLTEHSKVSVKKDFLIHDKLHKLIFSTPGWPPATWQGIEDLKNAFNNLQFLGDENIDRTNFNLNDQQKVSLEKDRIMMEDAIFDFFDKNKDKINDVDELAKLFSPNIFNFTSLNKNLLNIETEEIHDASLVSWLATRAAIKSSDFYKLFRGNISGKVAPISAQEMAIYNAYAGLMHGEIFSKFGQAYNKSLAEQGKNLTDADLSTMEGEGRAIGRNVILDSDVSIDFFRTLLIDGIAGSGKSSGVLRSVIALLQNSPKGKHLLDNVWFVNTTKKRALELALSLGFKEEDVQDRVFSREEILKKIAPTYQDKIITNGQLQLSKDNLVEKDGFTKWKYPLNTSLTPPSMIIMDEVSGFSQQDMLMIEDYSNLHGIMNLAAGDFDQSTLEGLFEFEDGTKLHSRLFAGNFMGSMKLGSSMRTHNKLKDKNNKLMQANLENLLRRNQGINGSLTFEYNDLGETILGDKIASELNIDEIEENIMQMLNALDLNNPDAKLGYIYDDSSTELYELMKRLNESGPFKGRIDFKEGSSSQGEELDNYVIELNGSIEDVYGKGNTRVKFWKDLYTGMTRAKKGTLIILKGDSEGAIQDSSLNGDAGEMALDEDIILRFSENRRRILKEAIEGDDVPEIEYQQFKGSYKKDSDSSNPTEQKGDDEPEPRKPTLSNISYTIGETIEIDGKSYTTVAIPNSKSVSIGQQFIMDDKVFQAIAYIQDEDGNTFLYYIDTSGDPDSDGEVYLEKVSDFENKDRQDLIFNEDEDNGTESQKQKTEVNKDKVDIVNNSETELNMLLQSFNTDEIGLTRDDSGRLVKGKYTDKRIDSLNGLIPLMGYEWDSNGHLQDPSGMYSGEELDSIVLERLKSIRSIGLYAKTQEEIIEKLKIELPLLENSDISARLMFKSTEMPGKAKGPDKEESSFDAWANKHRLGRFIKSIKEKVRGIFSKDAKKQQPSQKTISLFVTQKNDKGKNEGILEIPLVVFSNPLTMLGTKGFEEINEVANRLKSQLNITKDTPNAFTLLADALEQELTKNKVRQSDNFLKLLKLFRFTSNKVVFLDKTGEVTLSGLLTNTGPLVTTVQKGKPGKGFENYYNDDFQYDGEWVNLNDYIKESGNAVSRPISCLDNLYDSEGNLQVIKGHPLVLVSDAFSEIPMDTNSMIDQYIKQLKDPSEPKLVKRVYVSPPTVTLESYLQNFNKLFTKDGKEKIDKSMGTELTIYRMLQTIFKNNAFREELARLAASYPNLVETYDKWKSKIEEFSKIEEQLKDSPNKNKELLDKYLRQSNGLKEFLGNGVAKSWKGAMYKYFRELVLAVKDNTGKNVYYTFGATSDTLQEAIKAKIDTLNSLLESENWRGVFYHMPLSKNEPYQKFKDLETNVDNPLMFKNQEITINGKIDSAAFKGDILPILDIILKGLNESKDAYGNNQDTYNYLNGYYDDDKKLEVQVKKDKKLAVDNTLKNIKLGNKVKTQISDLIKAMVDSNYDLTGNIAPITITDIYNELNNPDKNYGLYARDMGDGRLFIAKLAKGFELIPNNPDQVKEIDTGTIYNIVKDDLGNAVYSEEDGYQFKGLNKNPEQPETVRNAYIQKFNEEIAKNPTTFQGLLTLLEKILEQNVIAFSAQDVLTVYENFYDKKSVLEGLKAEKEEYLNENNTEGAKYLQLLIDLLNPPKQEQIETDENNCANVISIS